MVMNQYKPEYLGKVIPADNPTKMADFVENRFDSFNKVYDACKDQSSSIQDVKPIENSNPSALSVQIVANPDTIESVKEVVKDDDSVTVQDGIITAQT